MSDNIQIILAILVLCVVMGVVIFFVARGSLKNAKKRGGIVTTGVVVEVLKQAVEGIVVTRIMVDVVYDGGLRRFNISAVTNADLPVGSTVQVIANFETGEAALVEE